MDYKVTSEIYSESNNVTNIQPEILNENVVSIFKFVLPTPPKLDVDEDYELERHSNRDLNEYRKIEIEHSISTELSLVGLQIWRGALLLADWLIYNSRNLPEQCKILELGSGVGLTSIVAAIFRSVLCTDINQGNILKLLENNFNRNKAVLKYPVSVCELNFYSENFHPDVMAALPNVKVILAADVVYDNDITHEFVKTVKKLLLLCPESTVYIALEKRFVFTIEDCDSCAPCYEYFLECLEHYNDIQAEQLIIDFPQYFVYKRSKELVMWKVTLKK